jgi:DNA-binding winged helix-turn-helix (wHTH) protein/tetratricopeptide (TPR) repeat protein
VPGDRYRVGSIEQIDLASAEPFRVGLMTAEPALRQVSTTTTSTETLQPRVMQVLVALARANGAIVSRDALVQQCWEGRIVGDDSINRVISRLRRLSDERAGGSFRVETIARVGYRLIGEVALVRLALPRPLDFEADPASATLSAAATSLINRPNSVRWLAATACGALLLVTAIWLRRPLIPHSPASLAVEAFTSTPALAESASTLRNAMVSAIAPERLRVIAKQASKSDYRLTGRLVPSPDGLTLYAQLHAPGGASPLWSPQKHFARNASLSGIGAEMAFAARCIIEGAEEPPTPKPDGAIAGWASYCEENSKDNYDVDRQLEALRAATRAEPRFATAQATLATFLGFRVINQGGRDPDALRAEGINAAAAAERLDPDNAQVYLARSILTSEGEFKSREAWIARALRARPTGSGYEFQAEGHFLSSVGRLREALAAYKRSLAINPGNGIETLASAQILSEADRYREARPIFMNEAANWRDRTDLDGVWLLSAVAGQDWESARLLVPTEADDRTRAALGPLIDALASGNKTAVHAAGAAFEPIAADAETLSRAVIIALALSGRDRAAVDAVARLYKLKGDNALRAIYWPAFAGARQTPYFEALMRKVKLFDYWRDSHRLPDFCTAANTPLLCKKL